MRIVFMGSPDFAIPSLASLATEYDLVGVIAQPDRPAGRGRQLRPPEAKSFALNHGLPVYQPTKLKDPEAISQIAAWKPDLIVVAAYGQILPPQVLALPKHGCLNVHASLLPRWRGAAPVQAALLSGDSQTGVTIMLMDAGLDTGPILAQRATPIRPDESAVELLGRLAAMGAALLIEAIPPYVTGELAPTPQAQAGVTHAPLLKKRDGYLDHSQSAEMLARQVRAYEPWPGSFIDWGTGRLLVRSAHVELNTGLPPGIRHEIDGFPAIAAVGGSLVLDLVQPPGRVAMPGDAFLRGAPDFLEDRAHYQASNL